MTIHLFLWWGEWKLFELGISLSYSALLCLKPHKIIDYAMVAGRYDLEIYPMQPESKWRISTKADVWILVFFIL